VWPSARDLHDDATVRVWADYLCSHDDDVARVAAQRLARTSKFFPSIAEMHEMCGAVQSLRAPVSMPALPPPTNTPPPWLATGESAMEFVRRTAGEGAQ
jgi:hypothetical protein